MRLRSVLPLLLLPPACVEPATESSTSAIATDSDDDDVILVSPYAATPALHEYEDSPRHPNADDPAIWTPPRRSGHSPLVIGVLKDGGVQVYDVDGEIVQSLAVEHRPPLSAADPASPGPQPDAGTSLCPRSDSGETFSRYNNVAIAYGFPLRRAGGGVRRVDVAVVTDRGCDELRFFAIEPGRAGGPLVDVTAGSVPRVFPARLVQPSPWQTPDESTRYEANPVDDQSTAYGLAVFSTGSSRFHAAVTQRSRSALGVVDLVATADGRITYARRAELWIDPVFRIRSPGGGWMSWTPCREDAVDAPQLEGLVYDERRRTLWASQEVIGVWAIPFEQVPAGIAWVRPRHLVERARGFGAPCTAEDGVSVPGNENVGGEHLEADVEGVTIVDDQLLVSSQGSDTFHVYDVERRHGSATLDHAYGFAVDGAAGTDGVEVAGDLLVVHNGAAPPPTSTDPVNGYDYEESTQFLLVDWRAVSAR